MLHHWPASNATLSDRSRYLSATVAAHNGIPAARLEALSSDLIRGCYHAAIVNCLGTTRDSVPSIKCLRGSVLEVGPGKGTC